MQMDVGGDLLRRRLPEASLRFVQGAVGWMHILWGALTPQTNPCSFAWAVPGGSVPGQGVL